METLSRSPRISREPRSSAADARNTSRRPFSAYRLHRLHGSTILFYWTCRIKSRTKHRIPRYKRVFEIIPREIGPITGKYRSKYLDWPPIEILSNSESLDRSVLLANFELVVSRSRWSGIPECFKQRTSFVRVTRCRRNLWDSIISGFALVSWFTVKFVPWSRECAFSSNQSRPKKCARQPKLYTTLYND